MEHANGYMELTRYPKVEEKCAYHELYEVAESYDFGWIVNEVCVDDPIYKQMHDTARNPQDTSLVYFTLVF